MASLEHSHPPSPHPTRLDELPMVDRIEEMNVLNDAVDRLVHGRGSLVFIHGEAGIGKTRLARELSAYARSRGVQVLSGKCPALFRMDGVSPYVLWKEVIKDYLDVCTPEQLYRVIGFYPAELVKLVPELSQKLRTIPQSFPISPEQEQNRLFEAVSQLITNISKETPLLVALDDLQWADQSSLMLLHYLARGVERDSLVLLGVYRDTDIDEKHPLSPVLTDLHRERLLQSVPLKRFSFDQVSEIIKQILNQDDVPKEFCALVYEKTRGNPFFVEEVMKSLKEEGVIYAEENKWKVREVSKIEFPETVKNVLKTRIGRLDEQCQSVLTMASFVGNDFTLNALSGITGIEEDQLLETMEKMLESGLVKEKSVRGEDMYSFSDIMIRDVVHEEISHLRHRKLHGAVGLALEKVYAEKIDEHFGELALHFFESGNEEKALDYFLQAGKRAQRIYAHNESFSYFHHALELLGKKEGNFEQKAKITERLGDLRAWTGDVDAGMEYWGKSLILWNKLVNMKRTGNLHLKMAWWLWEIRGDKTGAAEQHRMALEILEKEPESVELAALYEDICHMLWRTGKADEALPWADKSLKVAERLGASDVIAWCYNDLGVLSLKSGQCEKAQQHYEQGLQTALAKNLILPAGSIYNNLCDLYLGIGELQKCFEKAKEGSALLTKSGAFYSLVWIDMQLAWSYARMGESAKALLIVKDIIALDKRIKNTSHLPYAMYGLGQICLWLAEWEDSLQYLMEARDLAIESGEYQAVGDAAASLGELFIEKEDYAEAEKYLTESSRTWEQAGDTDGQILDLFPVLSKFYLRKGELDKARETIEKTSEHAARAEKKLLIPYTNMLKGMLLREQKNWQKSIEHFEESLSGYKSLNAQQWNIYQFGELLYEYGLMYLERNHESDKKKASSLLNEALKIYQKMDSKKKMEQVTARLIYIETGEAPPEPKPTYHIATGYEDLDKMLYGGIPPNYAVVLTSPSCDERDYLIRRFLETGAKKGEVTFYVTIDPGVLKPLAGNFQSNFSLFVCNPQADAIVKDAPNIFKLKGVENLTSISIALTSAIRKLDTSLKGPKRICIDLISGVLLQHHAVQTRRWLTSMLAELKSAGFTTLAVMDPRMHSAEDLYAILGLFQGEINLYEKETEKAPEKYLRIKRMSDQKYQENELRLKE